jgi:hypothetical protein
MTSPTTNGLLDPLLALTKQTICDTFWGKYTRKHELEAYWNFYTKQCDYALHDAGLHMQARTHEDILEVARLLKAGRTRSEIRDVLRLKFTKQHNNEDELMDRSINLAAKLLLMIDFDDVPYSFSGRQRLQWDTDTLKACLQAYFNDPPALGHEGVKFQRVFHAMNLERIAGVQVIPTNNLLDHLRLTHDDTRLHVFNHISFLRLQATE